MADLRPVGVDEADLALRVRLDGRHLDRKLTALRAMASQTATVEQGVGPDVYARQVAEETYVDAAGAPIEPPSGSPTRASDRAMSMPVS